MMAYMQQSTFALLVAVPSLLVGISAGYLATERPQLFAPHWQNEKDARDALDAYLSMDVFGAPDGAFAITPTETGVWVILNESSAITE
ncbi:MAG: hypothetical protein UY72_C0019G0006 [Candidatus Uhrbacteria bacterium GW2011_GWD2_52_7]|uniref:Uncharacterized protein n=1 Tax=Candidatus Uhrbacteria bacterium GW2011_GWD2_52_7 TaxID=1618989 RepID=A0A0G2ACN9_9BACT|nr:MAG: hypothetical protein UY72_C0019G0006 [Candidatus Uhrbacteria bacterium GW2011_GWD2_52_7]